MTAVARRLPIALALAALRRDLAVRRCRAKSAGAGNRRAESATHKAETARRGAKHAGAGTRPRRQ